MDEDREDGRGHKDALVHGPLCFSNKQIFPLDQPTLSVSRVETKGN